MNPHTRLMMENVIRVITGAICDLSAAQPTVALSAPMNVIYIKYLSVVAFALNVNLAFAKKLKLTATTNPERLPRAWSVCNP